MTHPRTPFAALPALLATGLLSIGLLSIGLLAFAPPARAAVDESDLLPIEQAFALSAVATAPDRIELRWKVADGYYLYRHRMGVQAVDPAVVLAPLQLPAGERKTDEFFGDVETYRDEVVAVQEVTSAAGLTELGLQVRYQGCADIGVCYPPHRQTVSVMLPDPGPAPMQEGEPATLRGLSLPGSPSAPLFGTPASAASEELPLPPEQAFGFEAIADSATTLLLRFTPAPGYYLYRDRSGFRVIDSDSVGVATPQWPVGSAHNDEHFGDVIVYFDQVEVPLPLRRMRAEPERVTLEAVFQGCQTDGICYPPMTRQVEIALPAAAATEVVSSAPPSAVGIDHSVSAFLLALLLAVGGGLILNLMPCVLPVLSLKALSLADSGRSGGHARSSALWYTAGVLLTFAAVGLLALGLRAAGQALGWGFQLQQPLVVGGLAFLMFAIGLNLSGVFSIGAGLAGSGQSLAEKPGRAGDFFTGVLAVVVASPCTAPFMGTALAFAFAAPTALALGVFLALGLGLALPFLLIGFVPALARVLPRPGAWMDTFKQVLAFPMYLTAIWLLWVLGKQRGVDALGLALVGLALLSAGLWWWGRQGLGRAPFARALALLLIALGLGTVWGVHRMPADDARAATEAGVTPYSSAALEALRAERRVVFVNMTADWCVTCKANEKRVLAGDAFRDALASVDAVYMKGDWTDVDPEITRFLEAHGAVGVPLYVVFGRDGGEGEVLPTVLTQDMVDDALARAAP